jgi:peptidoglycan/LPS O-acetylase OafA/YrhL
MRDLHKCHSRIFLPILARIAGGSPPVESGSTISRRIVPRPSHLFEIDVMRGLLSWWVVVHHALWLAGFRAETLPPVIKILADGGYAVAVFMMMSGFVITKLLTEKNESYGVFIIRRFLRLFPVFVVATIVAILIHPIISSVLAASWKSAPTNFDPIWQSENKFFWQHILAHLTMLHGAIPDSILPSSAVALLIPAWSISVEFQYYLVAPMFSFADRKFGPKGWLALFAGSGLVHHLLEGALERSYSVQGVILQFLSLFLIGMISYWIYAEVGEKLEEGPGRLLLAGAPLVYFATHSIPLTIWIAVFALILGNSESRGVSKIKALLNRPSLRFLGKISYSTYLIHFPLLWLAEAIVLRLAPNISQKGMLISLLLIGAPLTIVASAFLYRVIEKPAIDFGRRLFEGTGRAAHFSTGVLPLVDAGSLTASRLGTHQF